MFVLGPMHAITVTQFIHDLDVFKSHAEVVWTEKQSDGLCPLTYVCVTGVLKILRRYKILDRSL